MVEAMLRRDRRREAGRMAAAADYAALGWPVCPGAHLRGSRARGSRPSGLAHGRVPELGRACSCDRIGCPAPGAHPISPARQIVASADAGDVARWWRERPEANIILVTGRAFDVLDVPAAAGQAALSRMKRARVLAGPVALSGSGRALFFVSTRGAPADEDEWWPCQLDSEPDQFEPVAGLRWHTRNSFVLAPPSRSAAGTARWLAEPHGPGLPDALRLLSYLADACDEVAG
jgi:Bifunctional DNA primase/polymerase, N-terminal